MFAAVALLVFSGSAFAVHPVEKVIYSFKGAPDGEHPNAGLVADAAGNFYGTTLRGGNNSCGCGTVFELSPPATPAGAWTETVLYSFQSVNNDGNFPRGALVFDKLGNLYGTTQTGGIGDVGTVFELSPPTTPGGTWTETVICYFTDPNPQGASPAGKLTFDGLGNLYGTTLTGGPAGAGTVFRLKPPTTTGGLWTENVLHTYVFSDSNGQNPGTSLVIRDGAVYGSARGGTASGIAFRLVPKNGVWIQDILYNFNSAIEGGAPDGGLIIDSAGNLYGMLYDGGNANCFGSGCGAVFELSPPTVAGGPWKETTLHTFTGGQDGGTLFGQLTRDKLGNLYGTASDGGLHGQGTVFKLKPPAVSGGAWTEVTLHAFGGAPDDGGFPGDNKLLLLSGKGLYGTTYAGGSLGFGTVFNLSIVP
jgi:uncharacterized repeat protein (TIGR03803 family)